MADKLTQVAKQIGKTKRDAEHALTRYQPTHPKIERTRDIFDPIVPFEMEFDTERNDGTTFMDLLFNKAPPLNCSCDGRFMMFCEEFTLGAGSHLIQVTARYIPNSVIVFKDGVQLINPTNFYEYAPSTGHVYINSTSGTEQTFNICYLRDTWLPCTGFFNQTDMTVSEIDFDYSGPVTIINPPTRAGASLSWNLEDETSPFTTPYEVEYIFHLLVPDNTIATDNIYIEFDYNLIVQRSEFVTDGGPNDSGPFAATMVLQVNGAPTTVQASIQDTREYWEEPVFFTNHGVTDDVRQQRTVTLPGGAFDEPLPTTDIYPGLKQGVSGHYSVDYNSIRGTAITSSPLVSGDNSYTSGAAVDSEVSHIAFLFNIETEMVGPGAFVSMAITNLRVRCSMEAPVY